MLEVYGIHKTLPRDKLTKNIQRLRDFYDFKCDAPLIQQEFGFLTIERWQNEGHMPKFNNDMDEKIWMNHTFGFEEDGRFVLGGLGWCEAAFAPKFETEVLEDRGDYELVRDFAGRNVLFFKGRRDGFMPEYLDHPVKDMQTWVNDVAWRLQPDSPERFNHTFKTLMTNAVNEAKKGKVVVQGLVGGFMYLRSLIGPLELLYMLNDAPDLIHTCMQTWFNLADNVISKHQEHVSLDELFFAEDICYNHGCLISPDMMREYLFPYYQQLINNTAKRQIDKQRRLNIQIDTDGNCVPVINLYREIGVNYMSPFEVASGCDVVQIGKDYPWLLMRGGIDKRILAEGPEAIDRMVDRILPQMRKRGGYIPVCDHVVPEEVSFENYHHYRQRVFEYSN